MLYTAKQGVCQAECIEAKADDYATGELCRLQKILHEGAVFLLITFYLFALTSIAGFFGK